MTMAYSPTWPHVAAPDRIPLRDVQALLVLWNADKPHREYVQMHASGVTDWPHPGYQARQCPCGTVFIGARDVLETYCGGPKCGVTP